jgi:hypothetical protein
MNRGPLAQPCPLPEKPKALATVVGKSGVPVCLACVQAESDLTKMGFDVTFLNADSMNGMVWLSERGYPLDGPFPKVEIDGWPVKGEN